MEAEERIVKTIIKGLIMGRGYSGETSFDFEIERWKNKESGELLVFTHPNRATIFLDDNFEFELETISLAVEGRAYFQPGKFSGPYEDSYPDSSEAEITVAIGPDGKDWADKLTQDETGAILAMIDERVQDGDPFDPDDYED